MYYTMKCVALTESVPTCSAPSEPAVKSIAFSYRSVGKLGEGEGGMTKDGKERM